jgi:hypothetical protein
MSQTYPFESFISSLNVEGPESNGLSEKELADELAIFANAQFTFDMPPGMGIQDDKPMPPEQHHRYSYQHQQDLVLGHVAKLKQDQQPSVEQKAHDLHALGKCAFQIKTEHWSFTGSICSTYYASACHVDCY